MPCTIRPATPADAGEMLRIYAPYVLGTTVSFETEVPTAAQMQTRIENTSKRYPWLVLESPEGHVAGYAYASEHRSRPAYRWAAETTIYLSDDYRRRGQGSVLYEALLSLMALRRLHQAIAVIALPNRASVAFHEKLGFREAGLFPGIGYKMGRWVDVGYWRRVIAPLPPTPMEPFSANAMPPADALQAHLEAYNERLR